MTQSIKKDLSNLFSFCAGALLVAGQYASPVPPTKLPVADVKPQVSVENSEFQMFETKPKSQKSVKNFEIEMFEAKPKPPAKKPVKGKPSDVKRD